METVIREKWRESEKKGNARKVSTSSGKAEEKNLVTYFGLMARLEASLEFPEVSAEVHPPTRAICRLYLL